MEDEDYEQLLRWASSIGITDAPLNSTVASAGLGCTLGIATFPEAGGRGLAALRDIKQGELILRVPRAALLGVHCARNDPHIEKFLQEFPRVSSVQILAVYLLSEVGKGNGSCWFPYFQHLPRIYHLLAHFSSSEAQELQVEDAMSTAKVSSENCRKLWEQAFPLLEKIGIKPRFTTFKAWLWATSTISSRTLHVPWDEAGVLCPIGDLFNYDPPGSPYSGPTLDDLEPLLSSDVPCDELKPKVDSFLEDLISRNVNRQNVNYIDDDTGPRRLDGGFEPLVDAYCFYARKSYKKLEQVLLCYGQYTNLELMEHYGFVMSHNPNDAVYLPLPHSSEFGFPESSELQMQQGSCCIQVGGVPSFSLLQMLRLKANPVSVRKSLGYLAVQGMRISKESDERVYRWLTRTCQETLERLPTTITEDVLALKRLRGKCKISCCSCLETYMLASSLERRDLSIRWRLIYKMTLRLCIASVKNTSHNIYH